MGTFLVFVPDNVKRALGRLGDEPAAKAVSHNLIRDLIARGLIEANHIGGVRFTDAGKKLFREVRGESPKRDRDA